MTERDLRRELDRLATGDRTPTPTFLGRVQSESPQALKFMTVQPVAISGTESVGGSASTVDQGDPILVAALDPAPKKDDLVRCYFLDHRWVAERVKSSFNVPCTPCTIKSEVVNLTWFGGLNFWQSGSAVLRYARTGRFAGLWISDLITYYVHLPACGFEREQSIWIGFGCDLGRLAVSIVRSDFTTGCETDEVVDFTCDPLHLHVRNLRGLGGGSCLVDCINATMNPIEFYVDG